MKFRIVTGTYSDKENKIYSAKTKHNPDANDVIESSLNLVQKYNAPGFPPKFEYLDESRNYQPAPVVPSLALDNLSVPVLKAYAIEKKINIKECKDDKPQIIAAIRSAEGI